MAGFGEVRVKLGLDTSAADKSLSTFFNKLRKDNNIPDPFKGLDKNFDKIAAQSKKLGFEWDAVTKKFKSDGGFTQNLTQMEKTLTALGGVNQKTANDFDKLAQRIKGSADSWKFITDGSRQYANQQQQVSAQTTASAAALEKLGLKSRTAGTEFKLLGANAQLLKKSIIGFKSDGLKSLASDAKNADGSVKGLSSSAKNLTGSLKGLKGGTGLKQVGIDAKGAEASTKALGLGVKTLGGTLKAVGQSSNALKPLGATMKTINTQSRTAGVGVGVLAQKLREVGKGNQLSAVPVAFSKVSTGANRAAADTRKLAGTFKEAGKQATGFNATVQQSFNNILQGIPQGIGLAIGNLLIAPLRELAQVAPRAIAEFSKLDETIQLTLSIVGASADKFGQLQQSILGVSSVTAATAQEVGQVAQALSRAGFSLEEIDSALVGIVQGAEATGTSYEEMGKIVVSALGAFGLAASDAADVADTLTVAANGANTDVVQLGDALKYVGPIANAVGQDLQETNVQLQVLANSGIQASTAGTSLRTILTNLQIAAGGAGEEFTSLSRGSARLGKAIALIGADLTDTNGELKTGKELVTALSTSMSDLDPGERAIVSKVLAGSEGLPALNALISATGAELDDFANAMDNRAGAAADTAAQALSGLSGSFKILNSNLSAALIEIGAVIAAGLTPLVKIATAVLSVLNQLPGPIKSVAVALGLLGAAIGAVVVTMNTLKGTIVATFAAGVIGKVQAFTSALTTASLQNGIADLVTGLGRMGVALKGKVIAGLVQATSSLKAFTAAVKSGAAVETFTNFLKGISQGFKGIGAAGTATQLTLDFAGAAGKAGTSAQVVQGVLPGLATAFGATGTAAAASGTGVAAAGTASAAATPAVAGLGASLGSLLLTLAPIAAVVGAVALAFVVIKDKVDAYKAVVDPLQESQSILNDVLEESGEKTTELGFAYTSWGKGIEDALGPLDRLLGMIPGIGALYDGIKFLAEGLGRLDNWAKNNVAVAGLSAEYTKFKKTLAETKNKIEENRAAMAGMNPVSEEYGRLAAENAKLAGAEQAAIENRIKSIDATIKKLSENEGANKRTIEALKKMKGEYEGQLPVIKANVALLREEEKAHEDAGGAVQNFTAKMEEAGIARENAYKKADTKVIQTELKALNELKKGLISEAEQRAINATATAEAAQTKLEADNKYFGKIFQMYKEGAITQDQYEQKVGTASKEIEKSLKAREEAEIAAQKATAAAINAALQDYEKLVTTIGQAVGQVNNMLGELGNVGSAGISAFKSLASAVTDFRMQQTDKNEQRELAAIDSRYKRQKDIYSKLGKDTAALDRENANKKRQVEIKYEQQRRAAMQEQIDFEAQAIKAQIAQKEIELQLWYAQQKVANEIAQQQAQIAVLTAEADGASPEQIAALKKVRDLTAEQGRFLGEMYSLKQEINKVEGLTAKQQLNTKAAAADVRSEFGYQVTSINSVKSAMDGFLTKVEGIKERVGGIGEGLDGIPNRAGQVAEETRRRIEDGVSGTSFEAIKQNFINGGITAEEANYRASLITGAYAEAGNQAGSQAAANLLARFGEGGAIPKDLIKSELVNAMMQGADIGVTEAEARFSRMPDAMPTQQVAAILGNAVGGGAEEGMRQLAATPLPQGVFAPLGVELSDAVTKGADLGAVTLDGVMNKAGTTSGGTFGDTFVDSVIPAFGTFEALVSTVGREPAVQAANFIAEKLGLAGATGGQQLKTHFITELGNIVPVVDQTAQTIGERFGDMIPKQEIADELRFALEDGTTSGVTKANDIIAKLPDAIPRDEVAKILGEGIKGGVEEGEKILNLLALTSDAKNKLKDGVKEGLAEGGKTGAKAVGEEMKNTQQIGDGIKSSLETGIREGLQEFPKAIDSTASSIDKKFSAAGASSGKEFSFGFKQKFDEAVKSFDKAFDSLKFTSIGTGLRTELTQPIDDAVTKMGSIKLSPNIGNDATAIQKMADAVGSSGMGREFRDANTAAKGLKSATSSAKTSAGSLLGTWRQIARAARDAARAASGAGGRRALGGPVTGGQNYTVNEMGKEMFMSNSGRLSEIKAPAWGDWRAPTSGTVIPANISAQIRESREASKADQSLSMLQQVNGPSSARPSTAGDGSGFERALLGHLAKIGNAGSPVTNNVSITSANPVGDASRVMADLARLRAMRRR